MKKYLFKEIIPVIFIILGISFTSKKFVSKDVPQGPILVLDYFGDEYDSILNNLDSMLLSAYEASMFPGAAVTIVKDNHLMFRKCYGVKEFGSKDSIDEHTVFRLGSVSKSFAAVLTGIMIKQGYFNWDDTVKNFLPDFQLMNKDYEKQLTIRHVLSHTTGLPVHAYTVLLDDGVPYERIKPLLCSIPSIGPPGQYYSYQNVAYSLIADVMKSVTQKNYDELLKEKLFAPFNMNNASANYSSMIKGKNTARPHIKIRNGKWYAEKHNKRYYSVGPAAGVNASIYDMTNYLMALLGANPGVIDTSMLMQVYEPQIVSNIKWKYRKNWKKLKKVYYAFGWRVFEYADTRILYHSGYVRGYKAEIALIPEENLGMALLFNGASSFASTCIPSFFDNYLTLQQEKKDSVLIYSKISI